MAKAKKQVVETTVKFPEPTIHDFSVISEPVITEKSMKLMQEGNKIVLKVAKDANADKIKLQLKLMQNLQKKKSKMHLKQSLVKKLKRSTQSTLEQKQNVWADLKVKQALIKKLTLS